jgi:hypothetical protein
MTEFATSSSDLNKFVKQINAREGFESVKYYPARTAYNLPSITGKIEGGLGEIKLRMKEVFGNTVKVEQISGELAKRVSGKYDSFSVTLKDGSGFYLRTTIGEKGNLQGKDLTPSKFGLNGKTLTKANFAPEIEKELNKQRLPPIVFRYAKELLELSSSKGESINGSASLKEQFDLLPKNDLQIVGKNFGEVFLANWCLRNKPHAESIFFPESESNPLADFVVNFTKSSKKPPLNVSAKFEGGANASLKSIIPPGTEPPASATAEEKKAFKAIMAVAYDKIIDGLLNAEKILDTPEYKAVKKMVGGGDVTLQKISTLVENALVYAEITSDMKWNTSDTAIKNKYESFLSKLKPFFDSINGAGKPNINSIPKIIQLKKGNHYHPIMYAFSVALADRFNSSKLFTDVLNKAATQIKAEQIYIDISKEAIKVKVKKFEESKFRFAPGAFSYSADNVRMKVNMIK